MKMDDYRHAADRVHIAEHCRQEVMNMTKNTEPKSRTPMIRVATGIAAAAAVLGITGGFGMMLHNMKTDMKQDPAAQLEEQVAAQYPEYFREYYEARAGHPVDFDFTTLTGTDLDETWEFDTAAVHLVAAITDGWTLNYLYTVTPKGEWECTANNINLLPMVAISADGVGGHTGHPNACADNDCNSALIDKELREDGSLLCLGTVRISDGLTAPLSGEVNYYVNCFEHTTGNNFANTDHPISFNLPAERAECRPLANSGNGGTFTAAIGLDGQTFTFTHSVVTPLGVILTNYDTNEIDYTDGSGGGSSVQADAVTVMKAIHGESEPQPAEITYPDMNSEFAAVGDYALYSTWQNSPWTDASDESDVRCTCWLPFTEPQPLDDVMFLQLYTPESLAENEIAACAEVNMQAEGEGKPVPVAVTSDDREFPLYDAMTGGQRTRKFSWGLIYLDDFALTEDGKQAECFIRVVLNDDIEISEGDTFAIGLDTTVYSADMEHMIYNQFEITEMQLSDPHSAEYRILFAAPEGNLPFMTRDEDGGYSTHENDDFLEKQPLPDYMLYELSLGRLAVLDADGNVKKECIGDQENASLFKVRLKDYSTADDKKPEPNDPSEPYPTIDDIAESLDLSAREFEFGTVIVDGYSTDQDGNPMIDIGIYPNGAFDSINLEDGKVLAVRVTPVGYDEEGNRYEMHFDECQQGAMWYYTDLQYTDGSFHMHLGLDPRCMKETLNENGEYYSAGEQSVQTVDWRTLNIQLYLNALCIKNGPLFALTPDGGSYADENVYEYQVKAADSIQPWQFRFGKAAVKE